MALSQIQCLDDNNVNPRTHESKPEFFYCEDQRLALEVLLRDGREGFGKYLETRGLRGFLSDPELEVLARTVEPYDPGSELFPEGDEDEPLSLHYWPELSDTSIPQMDLGWPDSDGYRGVTRTTVYTQPPMEGQVHIKEVVRKMIAQAQKVIGVVMDVFTDVDIFRDLLDACFKKKVSVYILLERTALPHFLSMCQRANMHAGHLKNLRVRCTGGADFVTRSCTKISGRMSHRFMFIDGDKAVSGSYSFTWMSSRLDRNLITVITGQAVDGFDRLFRFLYASSSSVNLRKVSLEPEPEPEPVPLPTVVAPPSAAIARKLFNPKYALVAASNPSPTTSVDSPKETEDLGNSKKNRRRKAIEEDAPPLHPGLVDLEKAQLISYLPTWPEPDPSSDVIGFINIRDTTKPTQVHLQRHEMFETSQAIRFSSPIAKEKETLPEVAKPRQLTVNYEDLNKLQPAQNTKTEKLVEDKPQPAQVSVAPGDFKSQKEAPEQKSAASEQKWNPDKDTTEALNTVNILHSSTATSPDVGHNTPHLSTQSNSKTPAPDQTKDCHTTQTFHTNSLKSDSLPETNTNEKEAETVPSLNKKALVMYRTHVLKSENVHTSQLHGLTDLKPNTEEDAKEKTVLSHADSHRQAVNMQPEISSEMTPNTNTPIVHSHISTSSAPATQSVSSASRSENNHTEFTTEHQSTDTIDSVPSTSSSSFLRPLPSSSTASDPPFPSSPSSLSSSLTSAPPIPKPRTVQLVIKDSSISNSHKLPEISVIKKTNTSTAPLVVHSEPAVVQTPPVKEPHTVPELLDQVKPEAQKDTHDIEKPKETPRQKQSATSQETKGKETNGQRDGRAETQPVTRNKLHTQSNGLITGAPKAANVTSQEIIPKDVDSKTLVSSDCKITPKTETATVETDTTAPEKPPTSSDFSTNEKDENVTNCNVNPAHDPDRLSYYKLTPEDIDVSEDVDSVKTPAHIPVSTSQSPCKSNVSAIDGRNTSAADAPDQQGKQARFTPTASLPNAAKHNTDGTFQEQTPKARASAQSLRLYLTETNVPDLRSPTPERESRLLMALVRTPTPDGFPSHASTPDSRTTTPDFRTPTPDSALSTTSEEYYECSDSPYHEPVLDHMGFLKRGTTEDYVGFTLTNAHHASTSGASPACINYSPGAATLGAEGRNTSCSDTPTLTGPTRVSSSSVLVKKVREPEDTSNVKQEDETRRKLNTVERRVERESQGTERRDSEEANRGVDHFTQDSTEVPDKVKEASKRRLVPSQSAAPVDDGVAAGGSTGEGTEPKVFRSTGDLKTEAVSSKGPDKVTSSREKTTSQTALRPSGVERRESLQLTRETEAQKLLHSPSKNQRVQQLDSRAFSPSRPPRAPRPLSATQSLGPRPWATRQLSQPDGKVLHGSLQVLDNTPSPRRSPSRPPPAGAAGSVGSATGRKQVSGSLLPRQPPAAQGRARAGQTQNQTQYPKPQASFLHTHSHLQLQSQTQNQMVPAEEVHGQDEVRAPFSFTFSKLYNLKGLKDKMSKLPTQSKRGSTSSSVQGNKSSS
ncbi:mucin-4 [Stegastes partitus]|uniref:Family with sequence similarity 83 member G n=1 Tax=Stegastes partitus TaxID=144197 RepID=A0A3B5AP99_9TELE|nr:PREDICTED: protein FAM83G [Stegastes partitus]